MNNEFKLSTVESIFLAKEFSEEEISKTTFFGTTKTDCFSGNGGVQEIPTFISVCPFCNYPNVWRTTGIIINNHKCENCKKPFGIKL